jgi:cell wall-associated NlpC family hydrolase
MDSVDRAESQAWSLWAKLAAPALLRFPVLSISAALVISTPLTAAARTLPRSQELASAQPTQRQMRVLRSYERYLARMKAQSAKASRAVKFAYRQVGKPYQWGGAGPRTYDCSGLVMAAWRKGGLRLPHRADLQHRIIRRKVGLKHLRPGDLVFFSGDHHVGIYVGRRHFLHAPHTGSRVQRGTLSGWRLRVFAGAARPAAPAYHPWPHWVRTLAHHADGHRNVRPHRRHGHAPIGPDTMAPGTDLPYEAPVPPEFDDAGQAPGADEALSPGPAPVTTAPPVTTPAPPVPPMTVRAPQAPEPVAQPALPPAAQAPSPGVVGLHVPLLTMSAPARGRHHTARRDDPPAPRPGEQSRPRPQPHWPRSSVQQQNDEQRFDRDFYGTGGDDDDDADLGNDGIDLRSLLGDAP